MDSAARSALNKVESPNKGVADISEKVGFVNEETMQGKPRDVASQSAKPMKVTSLRDMIEWVGSRIGATLMQSCLQ